MHVNIIPMLFICGKVYLSNGFLWITEFESSHNKACVKLLKPSQLGPE